MQNFKATTVGNINNTKNQNYIQKLKKEFQTHRLDVYKKNGELCRRVTKTILDELIKISI